MSNFSSPAADRSNPTTPLSMKQLTPSNRRKTMNTTATENSQAIKVICRFRPVKQVEIERYGQSESMGATNFNINEARGTVETHIDYDKKFFTFDRIFGVASTQSQLFESVEEVIDSVMEGFNGTVLAYGQTSSGKTHTMEGPTLRDCELQGVIPRMVDKLFGAIAEQDEDISFTLSASYFEVYCERIRDLLNPSNDNLKIREMKNGFAIQDITELNIVDREGIINAIETGKSYRASAATLMNAESSRSHSILSILVSQQNSSTGRQRKGKIFLVDLAGSEKISKTGAQGLRLEEAKNINKSLTALGMVINALCDGSPHVPYRDSKLTRILQDSLGGNSKTTLIICCASESRHGQETVSTLRFGERAKRIKNNAMINEEVGIPELKQALNLAKIDIEQLTMKLRQYEGATVPSLPFAALLESAQDFKDPAQEEREREAQEEQEEQARENALRIVELEEQLEAARQMLLSESGEKMLVVAESEALKSSILVMEEKIVKLETEAAAAAAAALVEAEAAAEATAAVDLSVDLLSPGSDDEDDARAGKHSHRNAADEVTNIDTIRDESRELQAHMSGEIEALESSLISKERETKSARAAAAEYADKYARLKDEHDNQIQRVIEKLAHEQHVRIDTEDKLEAVQQQLWALQPTKGAGFFGKMMKGLEIAPKKLSRRERDLTVEIEDLHSQIFQLNAAIETTKISHRVVIDTKESVTRAILQNNVTLSQERDTLLSRVYDLTTTVEQLTSLLRDVQQRRHQPAGQDCDEDGPNETHTLLRGTSATFTSLRGGHGHISSSVAIKGGGGRMSRSSSSAIHEDDVGGNN